MIALQLSLFGGVPPVAYFSASNEVGKKEEPRPCAPQPKRAKPAWRLMTEIEQRAVRAISLAKVRYPVASSAKRFARHLSAQLEDEGLITDAQANYLWNHIWRFRRQIDDRVLVDIAGNFALPGWKN
jgi:hypothetical protein